MNFVCSNVTLPGQQKRQKQCDSYRLNNTHQSRSTVCIRRIRSPVYIEAVHFRDGSVCPAQRNRYHLIDFIAVCNADAAADVDAMDENLTRGYCQLRSGDTPPRVEIVSSPPANGRGRYAPRSHVMPPLDTCRCIYMALLLCGAGFLLPYNSFITAVDYYQVGTKRRDELATV
jgi:hypothetical protein